MVIVLLRRERRVNARPRPAPARPVSADPGADRDIDQFAVALLDRQRLAVGIDDPAALDVVAFRSLLYA